MPSGSDGTITYGGACLGAVIGAAVGGPIGFVVGGIIGGAIGFAIEVYGSSSSSSSSSSSYDPPPTRYEDPKPASDDEEGFFSRFRRSKKKEADATVSQSVSAQPVTPIVAPGTKSEPSVITPKKKKTKKSKKSAEDDVALQPDEHAGLERKSPTARVGEWKQTPSYDSTVTGSESMQRRSISASQRSPSFHEKAALETINKVADSAGFVKATTAPQGPVTYKSKTGTGSFDVYPSKITTNDADLATFKAMLESYKSANGGKSPIIDTTASLKKTWEAAFESVYGKGVKPKINAPEIAPVLAPPISPTHP